MPVNRTFEHGRFDNLNLSMRRKQAFMMVPQNGAALDPSSTGRHGL
jgi:hypothetical protein